MTDRGQVQVFKILMRSKTLEKSCNRNSTRLSSNVFVLHFTFVCYIFNTIYIFIYL